ncbi:MAG: chitobiase/beta-hexosaminidase C-terminal domain-containing protein, partial [Bacteroidales bacterium]|nr:chitobiase/beta-hexosaminidase C-terminal domain-containing protein [Bacteroidales bacterium]
LKCNTAGNYIITAEADLVAADGHTTQVSASVQKFIYASTIYAFDDLYISQIPQLASVGNLFPIEVSADTDYDRINITQVEITREGAPTNNCSFFINNALKSCENGVCYNLGYLDKKENSLLFYNTFEFSCSVPGVYGFKFTGLLYTDNQEIKKETDTNYIFITESNFSLDPPIAQPTPGFYPAGQEIRLILPESAPTGAIIRYTIDGSEVTPSSNQYFSPIPISNDLLIRARAYHEQNQSCEALFRYDIVGGQIYFNSLSVFSYDLAYEKNQSFPLIVSADTNSAFVNLEKVEITKGGAPTNSCSFLKSGSRPVICENGVCENLGFLSNFDYFSGYYESFLFTCDSAGSYDFNFTGTLDFGDGTSVSHSAQITIEVLEPTYYLAPPIANPGSGIYPAGTKITLSLKDSLPGAYIRYTTNGSDVSSGSSRYRSPIVLNSDMVLKAKTFLDTQSSEQVEHNYYLPYEPYFENLQITNMPSLSGRFIPFNIEVTAQTDMPIVYISEVEILDSSDQPTSACSYRGVSGGKFLNIPCENGSCQDLGFLSDLAAANSYKNTFVFSCSDAGTYKFRFKGDLLNISHWSNQEQINIIAYAYSCAVDDPIPGEIWCLEDLYNMYNTSIPGYSSTTLYSYPSITYILMRDLDFENVSHYREVSNKTNWTTGEGWTPLNTIFGSVGKNSFAFFEGNDKNIINLYINRPDSQNPNGSSKPVGFFKNVYNNVRNLNLIDVNIVGNSSVGALGGHAVFCRNVENINITGKITGENKVGGVFGEYFAPPFNVYQGPADINLFNWNSNIIVDGFDSVGGIIGKYSYYDSYHPPSTVGVPIFNNINSTGEIFSDYLNVGGVFGEVVGPNKTIFLKECSFDGNIYSEHTGDGARIGGLIGRLAAAAIIDSCEFNGFIFGNGVGGNGSSGTGGLIGDFYGGHIVNSKASGGVINPLSDFVGGLVGNTGYSFYFGFIEKSYSDINLLGANYVGGIIAEAYGFDINECFSLGSVSGKDKVGGLIGELGYGKIFNSYSLGDVFRVVSGEGQHIAGFMGSHGSTYNVINSYSIGRVIYLDETSPTDKGFSGDVIHRYAWSYHPFSYGAGCYWDMDASQQTSTSVYPTYPNTPPVIGKPTVHMKDQSTFTTWDFTNIWNIDPSGTINNGYPYLRNNPPPEN